MFEICEDIGTCWQELGVMLEIPPAVLRNVDADYRFCREKAREILHIWMEREGNSATVGSLARALENIKKSRIAQKLLGMYLL